MMLSVDYQSREKINLQRVVSNLTNLWLPPPNLSLSESAKKSGQLISAPGAAPSSFRPYPFQVGILDAITDPNISEITVIKSSQIGWTTIIGLVLSHFIIHDPCPILIIQPTKAEMGEYSKDTIAPLLACNPLIRDKIYGKKEGPAGNTIYQKMFPGGILYLIGAETARELARKTIRVSLCDEIDRWRATTSEGDQEDLIPRRMDAFYDSILLKGSTPTIKGESRIERAYENSDQRKFHVPCPHCDSGQVLKMGGKDADFGLKWPSRDRLNETYYMCEQCHKPILHHQKYKMIEQGQWIAEKETKKHAGFHIWAAYSYSAKAAWGNIAEAFLKAGKIPDKLMVFVNTWLGETFDLQGKSIQKEPLMNRKEDYGHVVPMAAAVLVLSVDVQGNRLEWLLCAYGIGNEMWVIRHGIIIGNPQRHESWDDLAVVIQGIYDHESGAKLPISMTLIDEGFLQAEVYNFVVKYEGNRVLSVKGDGHMGKPLVTTSKATGKPVIVGTTAMNDLIAGRLSIKSSGPGCIHFNQFCDLNFFSQLTAEKCIPIIDKGVVIGHKWAPKKPGIRNEIHDMVNYNVAGFTIMTGVSDIEMEIMVSSLAGKHKQKSTHRVLSPGF